jgi:integrase
MSITLEPATSLSPDTIAKFWRPEELDLTEAQHSLLPEFKRWLERRKNVQVANFLTGKPVNEIPNKLPKEFIADVLGRFRPQSHAIEAIGLLAKLLDRANAEDVVSLCPPPIPALLKRLPSPFRSDRWPTLEVAVQLRAELANSVRRPEILRRSKFGPDRIARIAIGQMLVSAIVHGGLLAAPLLEALIERLAQDTCPWSCLGGRFYTELSIGFRKQSNAEFRRWYPDPLSSILLMQMSPETLRIATSESSGQGKRFIWHCISAYLRNLGSHQSYPNTLNRLLDAVRLDLETRIPIAIVNYAAREFVSHSLKPSVYRRLHGLPTSEPPLSQENEASDEKRTQPSAEIVEDMESSSTIESRWLTRLRVALRGQDRNVLIRQIETMLTQPAEGFSEGEAGQVFAGFALRLLSVSSDNGSKMAISTARGVALSISVRVGGLAGHDISNFGAEEWMGLFEEAISDAETPGTRRKLIRALILFQQYLEKDHGIDHVDRSEIFAEGRGLVPVDANIVSESEFLKIRERFSECASEELPGLATNQGIDRLADIAWLILTLAYRCGLRRMEVLKLELSDVLIRGRPELLVRPTEARTLKTKSSTRKLPLLALLGHDELHRLKTWFELRQVEERASRFSGFLFALPQRNFTFVPQDTLFRLLHKIMREVTGDPSLRFHHLRHSFASRNFIVLATNNSKQGERILATLPGYDTPLASAETFRQSLYGHSRLTRKHIWAVSSLLGHSGPDVSVEHYIHHFDIALAEEMTRPGIAPEISTVIDASGKSKSQAYQHLQNGTLDSWVAHLHYKMFGREEEPVQGSLIQTKTVVEPSDAPASLMRVWRLLFLLETSGKNLGVISERHGINQQTLEAYLRSARGIASLKLSDQGSTYRHRFTQFVPDRRNPSCKIRVACPTKPHETRDVVTFNKLASAFRMAYRENKPLMARVVKNYVQDASPNFGGLIFRDVSHPEQAIDFISFLKVIGLSSPDIEFTGFDVTSKRSPHTSAWRKALGIHSSVTIKKLTPPNGRRNWACPWLAIQPIFPDEHSKKIGSAGFRFLMVMAAIAMSINC